MGTSSRWTRINGLIDVNHPRNPKSADLDRSTKRPKFLRVSLYFSNGAIHFLKADSLKRYLRWLAIGLQWPKVPSNTLGSLTHFTLYFRALVWT